MTSRKRTIADTIRRVADRLDRVLESELTTDQRRAITSAVITLYALEPEHAGSCTGLLTLNTMGDITRHPCRYPHGHTGAHEADEPQGSTVRWVDATQGASHIDHAPAQCGAVATFDPGKPCILPPGHPYPKHRDEDGRGFTTNKPETP